MGNNKRQQLAEQATHSPLWNADESDEEEDTEPRFPTTAVKAYSIGDAMASRLVACLLGFVLFLKSQIPM